MACIARGLAGVVMGCAAALAQAQGASLNVVCSVPLAWCEAATAAFGRESGVQVRVTHRNADDALELIAFERSEPRHDVWYGGTYDAHLRAAHAGLTARYASPHLPELRDWSVSAATRADFRTVGIDLAALAIAYNHAGLAKKGLPAPRCWADLARIDYAGVVQATDPHAAGAGYRMIVTLVQLLGEEAAFRLLGAIDRNIAAYPHAQAGAVRAAARGEAVIAVAFVHDAVTEIANGFPVTIVVPCEGAGYDIGAMSIVEGGPNGDNARRFYDWALTPAAQRIAGDTHHYETPSHPATPTSVPVPAGALPAAPRDFGGFADAPERARLLVRWDRDVRARPH